MSQPAASHPGACRRSGVTRTARFLHTHPTRNYGWNWLIWVLALMIVAGVLGAATSSPKAKPVASPLTSPATRTRSSAAGTSSAAETPTPSASSRASTPRPTESAARRPVDTTGGIVINSAGAILPDADRTPGAVNPTVTQADINTTICVSGWTSTVRPPSSYTTELKERQLASGYAYQGDRATGDYEEDHLISLELGGSPTSELNLWPEPYATTDGARVKDTVENKLHSLVCSGTLSLATAQHAIARNWWTAYLTYVGAPPTTHTYTPPPPPPATTAPVSTLTCKASMSDPSPPQYSTTEVIVQTADGASVTATAHYKSTNTTNTGTASSNGVASIAFSISRATIGYPVEVDVTVTRNGASRSCSTSFTPR
jgi:hypothetical protein